MNRIRKIFESIWSVVAIIGVAMILWACNLGHVAMLVMSGYGVGVFLVSRDPKNALFMPLTAAFFLNDFKDKSHYLFYGIAIVMYVLTAVYFLIKMYLKPNIKRTEGNMYVAHLFYTVGVCIGGLVGFFDLTVMVLVLLFCVVIYFYYFMIINYATNFKNAFRYFFIIVGVQLFVQIIILHIKQGGALLDALLYKNIIEIGVQNINVASIYLFFAMSSMFWLALDHKKYDYIFMLGAVAFETLIILIYSRIGTLISSIAFVGLWVYLFVKSNHKKILLLIFVVLVAVFVTLLLLPNSRVFGVIKSYVDAGFSANGREELWPWCLEKFKANPIFGIGFVSPNDPVPSVTTPNVVLAHNTLLQYMTSVGIIGLALVSVYYVMKYRVVIKGLKGTDKFCLLILLGVELIGIFDQSPTMDIFMTLCCTGFIALAETMYKSNKTNL